MRCAAACQGRLYTLRDGRGPGSLATMALTLFVGSKRYSSWSLRPYLALAQTGVAFETKTILLD